jgi:hypothetical protein
VKLAHCTGIDAGELNKIEKRMPQQAPHGHVQGPYMYI